MRRILLSGAVVLGIVTMAAPADGAMTANTIGATATNYGHGANAKGTVLVTCTAGQLVQASLTLTQGTVVGTGRGAARCSGQQQAIKITVPARNGRFHAGSATACAHADNKARGQVVDQRTWCRDGGVTLS